MGNLSWGSRGNRMSPAANVQDSIHEMAQEIFELTKLSWIARNKSRDKSEYDLGESEFLTLDLLTREEPLSVGEIQRHIGILPAQMSRVVRSLEGKYDKPLIHCNINPVDKRKIDVRLTPAGRRAHQSFLKARIEQSAVIMRDLPDRDRFEFIRILRDIRQMISKALS
jgi:DNA-binding MarR family transcriptional regulator